MRTFEYKTEHMFFTGRDFLAENDSHMNRLGADGWELIGFQMDATPSTESHVGVVFSWRREIVALDVTRSPEERVLLDIGKKLDVLLERQAIAPPQPPEELTRLDYKMTEDEIRRLNANLIGQSYRPTDDKPVPVPGQVSCEHPSVEVYANGSARCKDCNATAGSFGELRSERGLFRVSETQPEMPSVTTDA
jgi:hypothetical protein